MFVKPKEGLSITDPSTMTPIPAEGREVPDGNTYWLRRLRDGDVELAEHSEEPVQPETDGETS